VVTLVAARALQSVGAAMLMPASLALVLQVFPAQRRGVAIGIWGAIGALAAAIGPAAGSAVVELASWRWAFLLNLPLGSTQSSSGRGGSWSRAPRSAAACPTSRAPAS